MDNIVIAPDSESIESLRSAVADAVVRQYGAERRYAERLCDTLPVDRKSTRLNPVTLESRMPSSA